MQRGLNQNRAMPQSFQTTRRVEFRDTDAAGIAHFSAFLIYMEQAEHEFLRSVGLSVVSRDALGTISWPRVAVACDFRGAAKFEELLDIEVRIGRLGEKSVTYEFRFSRDGKDIASGKITAVCCRIENHAPPQSIAIPPDMRTKLAPFAASQS